MKGWYYIDTQVSGTSELNLHATRTRCSYFLYQQLLKLGYYLRLLYRLDSNTMSALVAALAPTLILTS